MKKYNVAIVGATGLVGGTFLKVLAEYQFPIKNLRLLASSKSAGTIINYCGKIYRKIITLIQLLKITFLQFLHF